MNHAHKPKTVANNLKDLPMIFKKMEEQQQTFNEDFIKYAGKCRRSWTDEESKKLIDAINKGVTYDELFKLFSHRSKNSVKSQINKLDIASAIQGKQKCYFNYAELNVIKNNIGKLSFTELLKLLPFKTAEQLKRKLYLQYKQEYNRLRFDIEDTINNMKGNKMDSAQFLKNSIVNEETKKIHISSKTLSIIKNSLIYFPEFSLIEGQENLNKKLKPKLTLKRKGPTSVWTQKEFDIILEAILKGIDVDKLLEKLPNKSGTQLYSLFGNKLIKKDYITNLKKYYTTKACLYKTILKYEPIQTSENSVEDCALTKNNTSTITQYTVTLDDDVVLRTKESSDFVKGFIRAHDVYHVGFAGHLKTIKQEITETEISL